ncbi:MAG TPA: hypothetical protein DDZ96_03525 [Porphyromonadaceae bacterium]|nr:hypothetical protein [Porphyromonadaceae bacterium]HBL32876.1 hypothetical protein [Porphyromonadaceae bacterium]HBX19527.1 hypothetical protein [Porphyromonadaceae bacterium]HBX46583.1 hypothetical protein [Porphyromonadaceae bacterium]HCM20695.1 hypothetical protein [Porphyromonadaceae bacterium]
MTVQQTFPGSRRGSLFVRLPLSIKQDYYFFKIYFINHKTGNRTAGRALAFLFVSGRKMPGLGEFSAFCPERLNRSPYRSVYKIKSLKRGINGR